MIYSNNGGPRESKVPTETLITINKKCLYISIQNTNIYDSYTSIKHKYYEFF